MSKVKVEGLGGICATAITDSTYEGWDTRITSFELEYHRYIHGEYMTHRQFSRNAASSRAIPIAKVIEQVRNRPAMPIHWGQNQSGMKAKNELTGLKYKAAGLLWRGAAKVAAGLASAMNKVGLHKQIANRILEPFQMIKVVCTATEFDNFFYLRDHEDAQPEIAELARVMKEARGKSTPQVLKAGEWHLPYVTTERIDGELFYCTSTNDEDGEYRHLSLEDAIKLSASLCAQVSYRLVDDSIEKAMKIYDMLVTMKPVHASPFEHQATPMIKPKQRHSHWGDVGTTHLDANSNFWSGNLKGWIQNRQLIPGHVYKP